MIESVAVRWERGGCEEDDDEEVLEEEVVGVNAVAAKRKVRQYRETREEARWRYEWRLKCEGQRDGFHTKVQEDEDEEGAWPPEPSFSDGDESGGGISSTWCEEPILTTRSERFGRKGRVG
jgi:hypothetical protein